MSNNAHEVLATNQPPVDIVAQARNLASTKHKPVYLYQCSTGWGVTAKLTKVPSGALITIINKEGDGDESWNTGGC